MLNQLLKLAALLVVGHSALAVKPSTTVSTAPATTTTRGPIIDPVPCMEFIRCCETFGTVRGLFVISYILG